MFGNFSDLFIVLEFVLKGILIICCSLFSLIDYSKFAWCLSLPNSDIHIIWSTEHCLSVIGESNCIHLGHPLSMIDFAWVPLIHREYPDRFIERSWNELLTCRTICNRKHCLNVILIDHFGLVHLPYVKGVTIRIITSDGNVDRFNWVPCDGMALVQKWNFMHRTLSSNIVEH